MIATPPELPQDADDAVRLVSRMLRRGESGEALRERRRVTTWTASEAGLLAPSSVEERGTAVRIRQDGRAILSAVGGDGPEALRAAIRDAASASGGSPFLKARPATARPARETTADAEVDIAGPLASALARGIADPRGVTVSLVLSRVSLTRHVITPRAVLWCGGAPRLEASGTIARAGSERPFAFQSSSPFAAAASELAEALREAVKPLPRLRAPDGEVDVVFAPSASAVFWHEAVGHPLEASGSERASLLARLAGAVVAPPGLEVSDDATRRDLPGAYLVDDEGVAARPVVLLSDGHVVSTLTDRRAAGADSNGHGRAADYRCLPRARMSNLVVAPGGGSLPELVERCGSGLYVEEVSGGASNLESGRFALFVERAQAIRKGRIIGPTARFALSGDVLAALAALDPVRGRHAAPASGLALCVKDGEEVAVGGEAPAVLIRSLHARPLPE